MENNDTSTTDSQASKRPRKSVSDVWKHFALAPDKKHAKCLACQKTYKTSGNTSNLMDHLKRSHPLRIEPTTSNPVITDYYKKSGTYDNNSARKVELDLALTKMIALDVQPFRIVEDRGFREFVHCLNPRYVLPSRNTIRNVFLKKIYADGCKKLQDVFNQIESCAITTDCWSSKANESYLTVTCHFVDSEFKLRSAVLTTSKLVSELNHKSENIAESMRVCLNKWNIFHKVSCIVTDNAASMIKACELLEKRNLPCFAHSINLVVQDVISTEKVKLLMTKCKTIVTYFKKSTIAYAKFRMEQSEDKQYSLIQEVDTRWNSAFAMVKRILLTKDAIFSVLLSTPKSPQILTAEEIEQLEDICSLLEPFDTNTNVISGNQYVTISQVIPVALGLYYAMTNLKPNMKTELGLESCTYLVEKIQQRLFIYESRSVTRFATILDPRFKKEGFRSTQNATQGYKMLENELVTIRRLIGSRESREESPTAENNEVPDIFQFMKEKLSTKAVSNRADAIISLREYAEKPNQPISMDPLEYWKTRSTDMKEMQVLALRYLCIPATSTESERMFSKAGQIISERRTKLKEVNVDMLLFINKNNWLTQSA